MSRDAARGGTQIPSIVNRSVFRNTAEGRAASQSRTQDSRSQANTNARARQKHTTESSLQAGPSAKHRKSTPGAGSSAFGLMHVDRRAGKNVELVPDYKFTKVQTDFWKDCDDCYIFGQQTF